MKNIISKIFGHAADKKRLQESDAMDAALSHLEGVAREMGMKGGAEELLAKTEALTGLANREGPTLTAVAAADMQDKAQFLMRQSGCAPITKALVYEHYVVFVVPAKIAWSLDVLEDYLRERGLDVGRSVMDDARLAIATPDLRDLKVTRSKSRWMLAEDETRQNIRELEAELDTELDALRSEEDEKFLAEVNEQISAESEDDFGGMVGIEVDRLRRLQAIERAANQLLNHVEYRVNHVFKGDSKSYYVRYDDLQALKEAFK